MGCDYGNVTSPITELLVSIHAPRVGCDLSDLASDANLTVFQFTHPVWGATWSDARTDKQYRRFNSRTPCGVRLDDLGREPTEVLFQFTHPVWGATNTLTKYPIQLRRFNSRTPCGVRRLVVLLLYSHFGFNSRTPCGVRLPTSCHSSTVLYCFNSRTPCGVRLPPSGGGLLSSRFQFTHPVWGATAMPKGTH